MVSTSTKAGRWLWVCPFFVGILRAYGSPFQSQNYDAVATSRPTSSLPPGPVSVDSDVALIDWAWNGDGWLVASIPNRGQRTITRFDLSGRVVSMRAGATVGDGYLPVFVDSDRFVYFKEERGETLLVIGSVTKGESEQRGLGPIGVIGSCVSQDGALWFHAVSEHRANASVRMFVAEPRPFRLTELGSGYYPRPMPGQRDRVLFVDAAPEHRLLAATLGPNGQCVASGHVVLAADAFCPGIAAQHGIVIQRGESRPSVELLTNGGEGPALRLSGDSRSAYWPVCSPSGRLVAYGHWESGDRRAHVLEVVDLGGKLVYQVLIGSQPVTAAFQWGVKNDRLMIVSRNDAIGALIEVVDLEAVGG